jgi:GrpB-like predicted nucleotidyltransferase (UPF0157 family)
MDEVEIVDYDPRWPLLFVEEARRLRAVLDPSQIMGLEHFGSTAIPGLSAKPIIDILIAVRSLAVAQATVALCRLPKIAPYVAEQNPGL